MKQCTMIIQDVINFDFKSRFIYNRVSKTRIQQFLSYFLIKIQEIKFDFYFLEVIYYSKVIATSFSFFVSKHLDKDFSTDNAIALPSNGGTALPI